MENIFENELNQDAKPIFGPEKNNTFEEGWADFTKYLKNHPMKGKDNGKEAVF